VIDAIAMTEAAFLNDVERMRVLSHNLANAGTTAFKREISVLRPGFEQLLGSEIGTNVGWPAPSSTLDMSPGPLKFAGNPLDLAVEGDGFFVLDSPSGPVYTRQGSFQIDTGGRLVGANGLPVLGENGVLSLQTGRPRIAQDGGVWDGDALIGRLQMVRFERPAELTPLGAGMFATDEQSARELDVPHLRQGYLEAANVVGMHEMVRLIETVRHFEASQRLARSYDGMLGIALEALGQI
jgi:flagellar basal-body rod protein FlgF